MAPSNYTLRFDAGVTLQKFSASTLQKTKRTVDEVKNANHLLGLVVTLDLEATGWESSRDPVAVPPFFVSYIHNKAKIIIHVIAYCR